jgi:hypothetical protein
MRATIWMSGGRSRSLLLDVTLDGERPGPRVVQPSSVSFSAPKAPAKSERVIVEDLGVPLRGGHHSARPPFWGRRT